MVMKLFLLIVISIYISLTSANDTSNDNIWNLLNFKIVYNAISGYCYISEALITQKLILLPLTDSISNQQLDEINLQLKNFMVHAEDHLQLYTSDVLYYRNSISDWIASDQTKKVIVPPSNITLASWTQFLLYLTECVASYNDGHKFVTAFVEGAIIPKFTTRSRYPVNSSYIEGETFFMNTAARGAHLHGHFAMKALEFFGLAATPSSRGVPVKLQNFKNIIFQDFPFLPHSNLDSWVAVVWGVITRSYKENPYCLNHFTFSELGNQTTFRECITKAKNEYSNATQLETALIFKDIYFSGNYQRPFPLPDSADVWRKTLHSSDFAVTNNLFTGATQGITILNRLDGTSRRNVDNLDTVIKVINETFPTFPINIVGITAAMPVYKQAELFYSSSILLSSHGSQLWNIIFCRPNSYVIEMQPVWYSREFKVYGQNLLLNYFIQFFGNRYKHDRNWQYFPNYGLPPRLNEPKIHRNFLVETRDLRETLDDIRTRISLHHKSLHNVIKSQ